MVDCKKVQGGTMVECRECHKVFYGNIQRKFCDECVKERARARQKERDKKKAEKKERHAGTSPTVQVYTAPEKRLRISSETGRIYAFVREVEVYNRLNGTNYTYGQYESMLFLEREKGKGRTDSRGRLSL